MAKSRRSRRKEKEQQDDLPAEEEDVATEDVAIEDGGEAFDEDAPEDQDDFNEDEGDEGEDDPSASSSRRSKSGRSSRRSGRSSRAYGVVEEIRPVGDLPITVKARCSDCFFVLTQDLSELDESIVCPACDHTAENLSKNDLLVVHHNMKSSRKWSVIATVAFIAGAMLLIAAIVSAENAAMTAEFIPLAYGPRGDDLDLTNSTIFMGLGVVGAMLGLVGGIMASMRNYVVEF